MAAPVAGVCAPWISGTDLPDTCCADPGTRNLAAVAATNLLYRLSGRQYPGLCERTIRPCGTGCATWARWPAYRDHWYPAWPVNDTWQVAAAPPLGGCAGDCRLPSVTLPAPVADVTQVVVDGAELDPATYRVVGHRRLERLDGVWPCTQSLAADSAVGGDPGTFQVTILYGRIPDESGIMAVTKYGCELAKHLCSAGTGECALPERTRSVVRQGITFDLTTPLDFLDEGRTGVPLVDLWLRSVNPAKLARRATIRRFDEHHGGGAEGAGGGLYTAPPGGGGDSGLSEAEILALIAAHPDLVKVTYETVAVSGVAVDGWYLHDGTLASFAGRTWPVIWEGTSAQIPAQGTGPAQFQTGDLAVTRTTTL